MTKYRTMKRFFRQNLFLLIAFVCSTSFIYANSSVGDDRQNRGNEVIVMSYNIRNGIGMDKVRDLSRLARVISGESPDVVAIQEIDSMTRRSDERYILGELAEKTGMFPTYAPAIPYDGGKYGIGLLSKEKPLGVRTVALPGREEKRILLIVEFKDFVILNSHFSLTSEDALTSVGLIRHEIKDISKPVVLCGDLNSHPDSEVIGELKGFLTNTGDLTPTFPADSPNETIDYIFIKDGKKRSVYNKDFKVIVADKESDHRPIVSKIIIK